MLAPDDNPAAPGCWNEPDCRLCVVCGDDICHRKANARFCRGCAHERHQRRGLLGLQALLRKQRRLTGSLDK